jgi:hypothetical protein
MIHSKGPNKQYIVSADFLLSLDFQTVAWHTLSRASSGVEGFLKHYEKSNGKETVK